MKHQEIILISIMGIVTIIALLAIATVKSPFSEDNLAGEAYGAPITVTCGDRLPYSAWTISGVYQGTVGARSTTGQHITGLEPGECIGSSWVVDAVGPGWCSYNNGQRKGSSGGWATVYRDTRYCRGTGGGTGHLPA